LKSPLCGFNDEELYDLAFGRDGKLWAALEQRAGERELWTRVHRFLREARAIADIAPPFEFYAQILSAMGGRRRLTARLGNEANDPIDEFLNLALTFERDHVPSLQSFLHWLAAGATEIRRDLDRGHGEVRVMTVHGAKGLEAEIVILPDTTQLPKTRAETPLIQADGALLWQRSKVKPVVDALAERQTEQMQEYRRLLYVAMTRARDRLYICGYVTNKTIAAESWYQLAVTALQPIAKPFETDTDGTVWRIAKGTSAPAPTEEKPAQDEPVVIPVWAGSPAPREDVTRSEAPSRLFGASVSVSSPIVQSSDIRFLRGRLIHRLLQNLPEIDAKDRQAAGERFLAQRQDLDPKQRQEILRAAISVLNEPSFAPVFAAQSRAEVPIVGRVPGLTISVNGQIDRIAVTDKDVLVVDFKTDRVVPKTQDDIARVYVGQMATYRALLQPLFPGKAIRCALLWTETPALMEIKPAALDAAITALGNRRVTGPP
jgi:ATP-dependent helicase/nuclease subunit A